MKSITNSPWKYREKVTLHWAASFNRKKEEMRSQDKKKKMRESRVTGESDREKTMVWDCSVSELTEPASGGSEQIYLVLYLSVDGWQDRYFAVCSSLHSCIFSN